jgi:NAD(P)-dependent dehydrogenase (short-subunit alcohol dehydrogenase family)
MRATAFDLDDALRHVQVNYDRRAALLDAVLPHLLLLAPARGGPPEPGVSSVAGYRGLPKALAYGPTKAALINLAESCGSTSPTTASAFRWSARATSTPR